MAPQQKKWDILVASKGPLKYSDENTNPYLQLFMWYHEMLCFPNCIKTLKTLTTNWTVTLGNELLQLQKGSHKVLMILIKILPFLEDALSSYHTGVLLSGAAVLLLLCVILSIAIAICMTSQAERQRGRPNLMFFVQITTHLRSWQLESTVLLTSCRTLKLPRLQVCCYLDKA